MQYQYANRRRLLQAASCAGGGTELPPLGLPLEQYTWKQINAISTAGVSASYFQQGDAKTFHFGGDMYTARIVDFNHDDLADGSGRAGITFGLENCLSASYMMRPSDAEDISPDTSNAWVDCDIRSILRGAVYNALPSDLQSSIKEVIKKTSPNGKLTTMATSAETLFLFSEKEITGQCAQSVDGEGEQYGLFAVQSRIRYVGETPVTWWTRSPKLREWSSGPDVTFVAINGTGAPGMWYPYNSLYVAFGFCI